MAMAMSSQTTTREFFTVHYDLRAHLDGDQADCLRLFAGRDDAELAAEKSANEAIRRYWWGTVHEDDPCKAQTNEEGERVFVAKAELHESTFGLRKIVAAVVRDDRAYGEGDKELLYAFGIVTDHLLGGDGEEGSPSTTDEGWVFVGSDKDAVKSACIDRAREFARELAADDPWCRLNDDECFVVEEGDGRRSFKEAPQEGGGACLTLRIRTALNPDYEYEDGDGPEDDYFATTRCTIKVEEMPIGKPTDKEYESKSFFQEWTKFPRAATAEEEKRLEKRRKKNRRMLEEAIERSKNPQPRERPQWQIEYQRIMRQRRLDGSANIRRRSSNQQSNREQNANNTQDGS